MRPTDGQAANRCVDHATTACVSAASAGAIARHREGWPAPGVVSLPKPPDNEPDSVGKPPGERIRYRRAVRRMRDRLDPAPPATRGRRAGEPPLLLTFHFGNETAAPMFQRCVRDALTPCAADMSGRWHGYRRAGSHGGLACRSTLPAGHAPVRRRSAIGRATHFSGPRNTRKRPHGDADFALWEADDGQDETTASRGEEMLSRDLAGRRRIRVLLRLVCRRAGRRVCRAEHDAVARRSVVIRAVASRAGRDIGRHGRRIGQCIGRCGRRDAARGSRAALLRPGRVRRRAAPRRRHGGNGEAAGAGGIGSGGDNGGSGRGSSGGANDGNGAVGAAGIGVGGTTGSTAGGTAATGRGNSVGNASGGGTSGVVRQAMALRGAVLREAALPVAGLRVAVLPAAVLPAAVLPVAGLRGRYFRRRYFEWCGPWWTWRWNRWRRQ